MLRDLYHHPKNWYIRSTNLFLITRRSRRQVLDITANNVEQWGIHLRPPRPSDQVSNPSQRKRERTVTIVVETRRSRINSKSNDVVGSRGR